MGLKCEECAALPAAAVRKRRRLGSGAMIGGGLVVLLVAIIIVAIVLPQFGPQSRPGGTAVAPAGRWTSAGDVPGIRGATRSVELADGRILVAGGGLGSVPLDGAAVFDPATGRWAPTGRLNTARRGNAMAVLSDGRAIVAGGIAASTLLTSVEIYDPRSGTWTEAVPMKVARLQPTLTVLGDGRVLVAGGLVQSGSTPVATASAEILDAGQKAWSPTRSPMSDARYEGTATRLSDGRVLMAGGRRDATDSAEVLNTAELFDPVVGIFTRTAPMREARRAHSAVALAGSGVLVLAGSSRADVLRSAEVYDAGAGSWSQVGALSQARRLQAATLLTDGRVLVAGGEAVQSGARSSLTSAELYDPSRRRWARAAGMACVRSDLALASLPQGRALAAGGDAASPGAPPLAQGCSEIYQP